MSLQSELLRDDPRLQACLTQDSAHLVRGTVGSHVSKVQTALLVVDGLGVQRNELNAKLYGPSTADAVLAFKTKRQIINFKYQTKPDNIVGKMTIAALDRELLKKEGTAPTDQDYCANGESHPAGGPSPAPSRASFVPVRATTRLNFGGPTGAPGTQTPAEVARTRAPGGAAAVARAKAVVARLLAFHRRPTLPVPPQLLAEFDELWKHFGMPTFPKNNPLTGGQVNDVDGYLSVVSQVLDGTMTNLGNAATTFFDVPVPTFPTAHAFTLALKRAPKEPPKSSQFPDGMYFNPRYLADGQQKVGPLKQTEVVIHECGHFVQNDNISDIATGSLSSAYGYSNYVLHCAFGRSTPFADTE